MGSKGESPGAAGRPHGFNAVLDHGSGQRFNSEVVLQNALRDLHRPDTVTWVDADSCDILGFAEAGHANARIDDGDDTYTAIRKYKVLTRALDEPEGSVVDDVLFARWTYEWNGRSAVCYKMEWVDYGFREHRYYAIVTDRSSFVKDHCTYAEELIKACGTWTRQLHDEVYIYEDGYWEKDKTLFSAVSKASWDDVIIKPSMKTSIINDVDSFFGSRETYLQYNIPWKRGVILHGPPGCGKTISIKALMNAVRKQGVSNLYVKSFKASGCQSDQASIRQIFVKARAVAPALLIFEDLDSLVTDELRSFFLNEVDGVEENNGLLIIGSTNHIDRLDTSITKRPSRFDRKFHFKAPSEQERRLYCQYWQAKLESNPYIDFTYEACQAVAAATEGFTFAYLKELFVQTLLVYISGGADDTEVAASLEQVDTHEEDEGTEYSAVKLTKRLEANQFYQTLRQKIEALAEDLEAEDSKIADKELPKDSSEDKAEPEKSKDEAGSD
jgi:transitional endoplasmic reticulum ATPase